MLTPLSTGQSAGAGNQQDSGRHGPNTFQSAGAHVWLHAHEVDTLSRGSQLASQLATSSTSRPQSQGSSNPQTYTHGHGQSLQYQPHVTHQVIHNQGPLLLGIGAVALIQCYRHLSGSTPISNATPSLSSISLSAGSTDSATGPCPSRIPTHLATAQR